MTFPYARFTKNRSLAEARQLFDQRIQDSLDVYARHHHAFVERPCPICGSSRSEAVDRFHGTYGIARCALCASLFVNPAPTLEALADYYNHSACNQLMDSIYRQRAQQPSDAIGDHRVAAVLEYLGRLPAGEAVDILEIGCGSGSFLSKLRRQVDGGQAATRVRTYCGIDIDGNAVARNHDPGVALIHSAVEDFVVEHAHAYDVVLHFELIEHLIDPHRFMQEVRRLLKPDGIVIFTTPNFGGLEMIAAGYNVYRPLAHSIFPPMHLNAFSVANITHFALRSQYAVVEIQTPGMLDVDMVCVMKEAVRDDRLLALTELDEDARGLVQQLIALCGASSHMRCVLRRA